jgi:CO dehydrogenase maturation factor
MKLAITGKGGVGKTTLSALLADVFAERGQNVLAIDADPAMGLAAACGVPPQEAAAITPVADMEDLIYERTGARKGEIGGFFKLNPRVDDIPERFAVSPPGTGTRQDGIRILTMGTVKLGGTGCLCPENALLRSLVTHLLLRRDEVLILDMEAGVEHLGRATAQAVDAFLVVLEPGRRSLTTAERVRELAQDLGITHVYAVGNKIRGERDRAFLVEQSPVPVLGYLSVNPELTDADMRGQGIYDAAPRSVQEVRELVAALEAL